MLKHFVNHQKKTKKKKLNVTCAVCHPLMSSMLPLYDASFHFSTKFSTVLINLDSAFGLSGGNPGFLSFFYIYY